MFVKSFVTVGISLFSFSSWSMQHAGNPNEVLIPAGLEYGLVEDSALKENFSEAVDRWNWKLRSELAKCVTEHFEGYMKKMDEINSQHTHVSTKDKDAKMASKSYQVKIAKCWTEHKDVRHEEPKNIQNEPNQAPVVTAEEVHIQQLADESPEAWSWCSPSTWICFKKQKED